MIEHYNTSARKATDINSAPFECLTADIDYWTDYIDAAANTGGFACFCLHDIEPNDYTGSNHHIYQAQADMLFGYACERGDLWIATFDDAMLYYNEWSTASLEAIAYKDESITVRLTDKEDNSIYNMPLTVKLDVPGGWEKVTVEQGGEIAEYSVIESESGNYAYVDITPDAGDALVKPVSDK
jgi:chitin deacetylase